jgi:hypothetical protein
MGEAAGADRGSSGATTPVGGDLGQDDLVVQAVDLPPEATLDAPELETLGFRPVASCLVGPVRVESVPTRVYVARYGDAYAFADPLDADVRLRVLTVLSSGRLVETRVLVAPRSSGNPLDELVAGAERARLAVRYPDRPAQGVHRQVVDVGDLHTLWIAHRGFVRKVQAADDVPDHTAVELFAGAMRRGWATRLRLDRPELARVDRLVSTARAVLLAVPILVGLASGLSLASSFLITLVPAIFALLARDAARSRPWRPWLLLVPLGAAIFGGLTLGIGPALAVLGWDLAVIVGLELRGPVVLHRALRLVGGDGGLPPPSPL